MTYDKPDDHRTRDTAFARMLAEALKSPLKPGPDAKASTCPDAEVLATYAEHGLSNDETARWEIHFANCGRCQKIIAVLAASGDELAPAEVERLGTLAATSAAREPLAQKPARSWTAIWRRPMLWRWLVPAASMASVLLWFALRQPPAGETLRSQNITTTAREPLSGAAQGKTAASSVKSDETQIAQGNLPAPPPQAPPSGDLLRDKEAIDRSSSVDARESARKKEALRRAAPAPEVSEVDRAVENRKDSAEDNRVLSAQAAEQKSQLDDKLAAAAPSAAAAPPAPPPAERERAAKQSLAGGLAASSRNQVEALAKTAPASIVFSSPDRAALWRLGSPGVIEHSADQGKTWQPQASGVTAELLAGSAASKTVAWAVGRTGTILRTEDGEHWQHVASPSITLSVAPPGAAPDWIGVEARDALHATITSRDLRRFTTADGGRTWALQQ